MNDTADDDWIAVDWGTTRLRAWIVSAGGDVRRSLSSEDGMGALAPAAFERALLELTGHEPDPTRPIRALCCGMVGARQGWFEAPYRAVPCAPMVDGELVRVPGTAPGLVVDIVPGLAQRRPADVMRGEETQIGGFLAERDDFAGVLCLPGTHTKWAWLADGRVHAFETAMSGELFALLSERSVLRHGLADDGSVDAARDDAAFDEGLYDSLAAPANVIRRLFSLRAENLLHELDAGAARARLSGLLLGVELAGVRDRLDGASVPVIGAGPLARRYARALQSVGIAAELVDGERLALAGLSAIRTHSSEHLVP